MSSTAQVDLIEIPQSVREAIAAVQGVVPSSLKGAFSSVTTEVFPLSNEVNKKKQAQRREMNERLAREVRTATIGDRMSDGSIYVGFYQGCDWFATATDALDTEGKRKKMTYGEATEYAKNLQKHHHNDWALPPRKR